MKKTDAARQAKIEALRDFEADRRMGNHLTPLSANKGTANPQDCSCGDDAQRRMTNHQKPLKFSKDVPA